MMLHSNSVISSAQTRPKERSLLRAVAIPKEHGGWSLIAEAVILGLLVAPTRAGALLAVGAFVAFVARTPARYVTLDLMHRRHTKRTELAYFVLLVELAVLAMLTVCIVSITPQARTLVLFPLLLACPLFLCAFLFDVRFRSRHLFPELLAAVAVGGFASAIALAENNTSLMTAFSLWTVLTIRSFAAIPFVHLQLALRKNRKDYDVALRTRINTLAQTVALLCTIGLTAMHLLAFASALSLVILVCAHVFLSRRPPPKPASIGIQQTLFGFVIVVTSAAVA